MTNASRLAGFKIAAMHMEKGLKPRLNWDEVEKDDGALIDKALEYWPENEFLANLCAEWTRNWTFREYETTWPGDVVWAYQTAWSHIGVHQQLRKNTIQPADIGLTDIEFELVKEGKQLLSNTQYTALAIALEVDNREDAIFLYSKIAMLLADPKELRKVRMKWLRGFSMQDYKDDRLPYDQIVAEYSKEGYKDWRRKDVNKSI